MRKVKKDLTELKEEEKVTGWLVEVYFQRGSSERYASITTDAKKRAESIATSISAGGTFVPMGEEQLTIIHHVEDITCISIRPLKRMIFVR